jgi:hypothetical protein
LLYHSWALLLAGKIDEAERAWRSMQPQLTDSAPTFVAITYPDEQTTILSGQVLDQGQLHAILIKIRDLNLILISVNPVQDAPVEK